MESSLGTPDGLKTLALLSSTLLSSNKRALTDSLRFGFSVPTAFFLLSQHSTLNQHRHTMLRAMYQPA